MAQPGHCYVQYFIPFDGDTEEHPNVFLVKKPQKDLRLGDIQQAFPLPGQYFFRGKASFGKTHVWFDLNDPNDQIPAFNGKVTLKVSRVSLSASSSTQSAAPVAAPARAGPAAVAATSQRASAPAPAPAPAPQPSLIGKASAASEENHDLLGVFGGAPTSGGAAAGARSGGAGATASAGVTHDLFAAPPPAAPQRAAAAVGGFGQVDPFATSFSAAPRPMAGQQGYGAGYGGVGTGGAQWGAPAPAPAAAAGKKPGGSILDGDIFNM